MSEKSIGYVEAIVRIPLYEGDRTTGEWGFVFEEGAFIPGIVKGQLEWGVIRREAKTISATVVLEDDAARAKGETP